MSINFAVEYSASPKYEFSLMITTSYTNILLKIIREASKQGEKIMLDNHAWT